MNRQQLSLIVILGLISSIPAFAAGPSEQGNGWRTSSAEAEAASSTLSGKLYHNSADQNGSAPYILLDRWGVTRGYVTAAEGVDLESCLGQQVSLQGTVKTLPGGDMPYMTCQQVIGGTESARGRVQQTSATTWHDSFAPIAQDQQVEEAERPSRLPTRRDMAADPAPRSMLPLHEVVLEPQAMPADDSRDQTDPPARRGRYAAVRASNYQETLPVPPPSGGPHAYPMPGNAVIEPAPMEQAPMAEGSMPGVGPAAGCGCESCGGGCESCGGGCESCGEGPCGVCCDDSCGEPCWGPRRPLFCIGPTGIWVKADYLQWWESGTHVPALVTTGPNAANPGYLGTPGTTILFGNDTINNNSESGGRIQAGMWLNRCATVGIEGEYFGLADESTNYYMWSDGNPIISRPFYDVGKTTPVENVELVAFPRGDPRSVDGAININVSTHFEGAGAHMLFTVCRQEGCWTDDCGSCMTYHDRFRADFIAGYRYLDLEDQLGITETLTNTSAPPVSATNPNPLSAFLIQDQFNTQNTFNGGDLGMKFELSRNRWTLDLFPRIALGTTHETVDINGSTRITTPTFDATGLVVTGSTRTTYQGGLLALPANAAAGYAGNIGHYEQDIFAVVPQLDANLGFQFTRHTRVMVGYSGMYWSKVARAGEQIDRSVNSTLLPGAAINGVTPTGDLTHPAFAFQQSGFWAQGINVGVDCRW